MCVGFIVFVGIFPGPRSFIFTCIVGLGSFFSVIFVIPFLLIRLLYLLMRFLYAISAYVLRNLTSLNIGNFVPLLRLIFQGFFRYNIARSFAIGVYNICDEMLPLELAKYKDEHKQIFKDCCEHESKIFFVYLLLVKELWDLMKNAIGSYGRTLRSKNISELLYLVSVHYILDSLALIYDGNILGKIVYRLLFCFSFLIIFPLFIIVSIILCLLIILLYVLCTLIGINNVEKVLSSILIKLLIGAILAPLYLYQSIILD